MQIQPWRSSAPGRPPVPLPPDAMPAWRGGRPLKAWTYVGAFGPDVMLCAARARVGPVPVAWWAVWDRAGERLVARTARGSGGVQADARRLTVAGRAASLELTLDDGEPIEVVSPHGRQYAWTCKRGGVRARGWLELWGARRALDLRAIVDESAGYHARHTAWRWSAGVGVAASGAAVAWNLVDGIHDAEAASERTVWVDGVAHEVPPVAFADDLSSVGGLRFAREAVRARRENLILLRSDYEQPFGTFSGELPVAGPLREGWGVMERHDVHW
ncbi:MAG TPA: DUF2804 family protein [Solirubrobacteraceae bacterium]|nr:DUF2804 family protein [Solirubrobacteraceae bacterium]